MLPHYIEGHAVSGFSLAGTGEICRQDLLMFVLDHLGLIRKEYRLSTPQEDAPDDIMKAAFSIDTLEFLVLTFICRDAHVADRTIHHQPQPEIFAVFRAIKELCR